MRSIWSAAVLLATLVPLAGCHQEGPAEQAGKGMDNAVRNVKDAVNPPGPVEKAGRAVDDAINK
jgi:predicted small lipoprotein YifL